MRNIKFLLIVFITSFLFSCGDEKPKPETQNPTNTTGKSNNILLQKQAETEGKAVNAANELLEKQQDMMKQIDQE